MSKLKLGINQRNCVCVWPLSIVQTTCLKTYKECQFFNIYGNTLPENKCIRYADSSIDYESNLNIQILNLRNCNSNKLELIKISLDLVYILLSIFSFELIKCSFTKMESNKYSCPIALIISYSCWSHLN